MAATENTWTDFPSHPFISAAAPLFPPATQPEPKKRLHLFSQVPVILFPSASSSNLLV